MCRGISVTRQNTASKHKPRCDTGEGGMMCGAAENRASGNGGNGGGLVKWWGKAGFGRVCSAFWLFFRGGFDILLAKRLGSDASG